MTYPKRLIEVDLPIKLISVQAQRETKIRHGNISTLHVWWARRPLAACRAVLCAALWVDPADPACSPDFRRAAFKQMRDFSEKVASVAPIKKLVETVSPMLYGHCAQIIGREYNLSDGSGDLISLRRMLLAFIADFANWDNSTQPDFLATVHVLTQAAHESLGGETGTRPLVVDPFAGGGAIPLEALRVGAHAFASDLNPVAVLLNKVVLEYIPRYGQQLADEVRKWGAWIKEQAEAELATFYPKDPDGATPIAYLWARTITCEGPDCGCEVPLLRSFLLAKKKTNSVAIKVIPYMAEKRVEFEVVVNADAKKFEGGIVRSGSAVCPCCNYTTPANRVKVQLQQQNGGANNARLFAVYVDNGTRRYFRLPTSGDLEGFHLARQFVKRIESEETNAFPSEMINPIRPYKNTRGLSAVTRIGCLTFRDLYNFRQLASLYVFYKMVRLIDRAVDAEHGIPSSVLKTLLILAISRAVSQNTSMSRWDSSRSTIKGAFSKQALAVVWDFAEANAFSGGSADWDGAIDWIIKFIDQNTSIKETGQAIRASALDPIHPADSVGMLFTDPPYFAAIPYGDLSDFFYVWLRRGLFDVYPELFGSELVEKKEELIVTNAQLSTDGKAKDELFFREKMTLALENGRKAVASSGIGVIVYAEATTEGWEAIIGAIVDAGWIVTASWPLDTEMENRTRAQNSASLQSSIHIVCRPREDEYGVPTTTIGDWREVLAELPDRIRDWLPRLEREGVVGADAIFACLGPAMEIYSRYARVEKASGEVVTLREYLEQVWAAVSREALQIVFRGADTTGFEEDARLSAMWLWTLQAGEADGNGAESDEDSDTDDEEGGSGKGAALKGFVLEYDAARKIAQGIGAYLEKLDHLAEIKGNKARLRPVAERAMYLFGKDAGRVPSQPKKSVRQMGLFEVLDEAEAAEWRFDEREAEYSPGKTTLDRLHQSMILHATGRTEALKRFLVEEGHGGDARLWRLADALLRLYPKSTEEYRWLDGLLARKKGLGF